MASAKFKEENESESELETMDEEETGNDVRNKSKLNNYAKQKILTYLQNPCKSTDEFDKLIKKLHISGADVENFIDKHAKLSQMNVYLECDSPSFQSVNNWLEMFKEKGLNTITGNEIPLLMKSVAVLEDHPDPSECDGINFQQLYQFLGDVMSGDPTNELDEPTSSYLHDVVGELMNDVNSEKGDEELAELQESLIRNSKNNNDKKETEKCRTYKEDTFDLGLDPLNISCITKDFL